MKTKPDGTIDFSVKRLGLKHEPKVKSSIPAGGDFNEIAEALDKFKKSFLPNQNEKDVRGL